MWVFFYFYLTSSAALGVTAGLRFNLPFISQLSLLITAQRSYVSRHMPVSRRPRPSTSHYNVWRVPHGMGHVNGHQVSARQMFERPRATRVLTPL